MKCLSIILTIITLFFTTPAIAITTNDILKKYGQRTVQSFIRSNSDGFVTIEYGGRFYSKLGSQSKEYITVKSVDCDFKRLGLSVQQADRMILEYIEQKKAERIAHERVIQQFKNAQYSTSYDRPLTSEEIEAWYKTEQDRREREKRKQEQENIRLEREKRERYEEARRNYLKSESLADKFKRKISPLNYWQDKEKEYKKLIKETEIGLRDSYLELEELQLTKDIKLKQAANLANLSNDDPYQAKIEAFEEYKLSMLCIKEDIQIERDLLREYSSYLSVATTEIENIQSKKITPQNLQRLSPDEKFKFWSYTSSVINENLPMTIDNQTMALNVSPLKDGLMYHYKVTSTDYNSLLQSEWDNILLNLKREALQKFCTLPDTKVMRDCKASVKIVYFSRDNKYIGEIYFNSDQSCRQY